MWFKSIITNMDSLQLRYILLKSVPNLFIGVYASDQIKFVKHESFAIIVNSSKSINPGVHWTAFYKAQNSDLEFWDSFGLPINYYGLDFIDFVKTHGQILVSSTIQVQSNFSDVCGHYCVYWLLARISGLNFENILDTFSVKNLLANDRKVKSYVEKRFDFPSFANCVMHNSCQCFKGLERFSSVCIKHRQTCVKLSRLTSNANEFGGYLF